MTDEQPSPADPITPAEARRVRRMLWWVGRNHPIRTCVEEVLAEGEWPAPVQPDYLCNELAHGTLNHAQRCSAIWALGRLARDERDRLHAGLVLSGGLQPAPSTPAACLTIPFACFPPVWLYWAYLLFRDVTARKLQWYTLMALGRVAYVPSLPQIERYLSGPEGVRKAARFALHSTLGHISAEDYGRLPPETTFAICRVLSRRDAALRLAALRALGNAGDGRAVEHVRRAARWGRPKSVRDLATSVLPVLEERLARETAAHRLLRAAQAPEAPETVLLRPAGPGGADESLLLRVPAADEPPPVTIHPELGEELEEQRISH